MQLGLAAAIEAAVLLLPDPFSVLNVPPSLAAQLANAPAATMLDVPVASLAQPSPVFVDAPSSAVHPVSTPDMDRQAQHDGDHHGCAGRHDSCPRCW